MTSCFNLKTIFPRNIIIFGCGGGGSRTVKELAGFLFEASNSGLCSMQIGNGSTKVHLVDHDIVEAKNCFRQDYYPWDCGELKVSALASRNRGLMDINPIPEASNLNSLPFIFTEDILSQPFCVISKLDHAISTSQIYNWLMENAPDKTWMWFFSGTSLKPQKIKGVYREVNKEIKLPYVTAYMYGRVNGQPIIPDLNDSRFNTVVSKPWPSHLCHHDIHVDTRGIIGRQSDGGGCGMSDSDMVEQASLGNLASTLMTLKQLRSLYIDGVVIPEIIEENGVTQAYFPFTLDEVFFPDDYPELVNILNQ